MTQWRTRKVSKDKNKNMEEKTLEINERKTLDLEDFPGMFPSSAVILYRIAYLNQTFSATKNKMLSSLNNSCYVILEPTGSNETQGNKFKTSYPNNKGHEEFVILSGAAA